MAGRERGDATFLEKSRQKTLGAADAADLRGQGFAGARWLGVAVFADAAHECPDQDDYYRADDAAED